MAYSILGVDFSHWQGKPDCQKLKDNGVRFAIVKAGEVLVNRPNKPLYFDDKHDRNIAQLKAVGIPCSSYYYFHPSAGASKQANHYASIWKKNPPDLPPVIDCEDSDGYLPKDVGRQLLAFIDAIKQKIGIQPIVYSRNGFLVNNCGNPDWPTGTKFWIARYAQTIGSLSPKIKDNTIIWQYTDRIKLPGLPVMDGNWWVQRDEEFTKFVSNTEQPLPIPEPIPNPIPNPTNSTGRVIVSVLNIRNTPDYQNNKIIGTLKKGTIINTSHVMNERWAEFEPGKFCAIWGESGIYVESII
jgi:GH25 family lysozyme M1 (1,4-beta-N-acetylmuramidase)